MAKHSQNIATRFQVYLERLKANEVQDFLAAINKMAPAMRQLLLSLDVNTIGELNKKEMAQLLRDVNDSNDTLLTKATKQLFANLESIAGYSAAFEAKAILNVAPKAKLDVPSYADAYKAALDQPLSATGQKLTDFIQDWSQAETTRMNNVIQKAWGEGWTVQDTVQSIRGTKALNFKDGIIATTQRNAQTVVQTSIQHVASTARMSTWDANSDIVTAYQWVSTLDSKTTAICRSLDGKEFDIGEGPVPPAHMNCRSTTVAKLDPSLGLDSLQEGATRSSVDGPVDADLSYYDWLKEQPEAFQNEALGETRAQLFRDGGLTSDEFAALNLNKNFQPLTLAEMQKLEPTAFEKAGISLPDNNN